MDRHTKNKLKMKSQLGMPSNIAATILMRDLLWHYIEEAGDTLCHVCGEPYIQKLRKEGCSFREIGRRYKVSHKTIQKALGK